jgi:hypothetical protein
MVVASRERRIRNPIELLGPFTHLDYERGNVLVHAWTAHLARLIRRTSFWPILHRSHPYAKSRIAGYEGQIVDVGPPPHPVFDQPPLLIVDLDSVRLLTQEDLSFRF